MKGLVLAGGHGTRLFPLTRTFSKHLLPVHDKAMVFYPISLLLLSGINELAVVCRPRDRDSYESSLGFLRHLGVALEFLEQPDPAGIPDGILLAEAFSEEGDLTVVLGDNLFFGSGLMSTIRSVVSGGATIFSQKVKDPNRFGILELTSQGLPKRVVEKPSEPTTDLAVVGMYVFDNTVFSKCRLLEKSSRGETEVAELINSYIGDGKVNHIELPRGTAWFDMGTFDSIETASTFVRTLESRGGELVGCLEEICLRMGFTNKSDLRQLANEYPNTDYKKYILDLIEEEAS